MIKRLQDISFRVSRYFRPLEPWHCGGLDDGSQCLLGPDKKGNCRAINDCSPNQQGKTWECTRSELLGGACKAGPSAQGVCGRQRPPCQPTRNIRARRQRFGWLAAASALAIVGLMVAIDAWQGPTNPGPLSQQHASFGETDCQACHAAAELPRSSWVARAFGSHPGISDEQKCSSCHALGEDTLAIHSLAADDLQSLTDAIGARASESGLSKTSLLIRAGQLINGESQRAPACSVCHQEHQGAEADISQVSDQQCAVCHTNAFDDFSSHTSFGAYPADKRTQIIFSHNTHLNKHFSEEDMQSLAPEACIDCHVSDSVGRKMEVKGFNETCSACHLNQVTGESRASDKGFAMLSIPALDTATLTARGVDIGEWPEYSDAEFTPLNSLLIAATAPNLAEKMSDFATLDLYDLEGASDAELKLVYDVVWTLKRVYFEMQRGGANAISGKLAAVLPAPAAEQGQILGLLPPAVIEQATAAAFPNLEAEMTDWLQRGTPEFTLKAVAKKAAAQEVASTPTVVANDAGDDDWLGAALDGDDAENTDSDDDWLSGAAEDDDEADDWLNAAAEEEPEADDDWLSGALDDDDGEEASADDDWLNAATEDASDDDDDWLSGSLDDEASTLDDDDIEIEDLATSVASEYALPVPEQLALEDRAAVGGWYYENYYLRYRPAGHADQLIVAWIERLVSGAADTAIAPSQVLQAVQRNLLGESTPGSCLKCHSVEQTADNRVVKVHWFGAKTKPSTHDFNAFKHQSHFAMVETAGDDFSATEAAGCRSCHQINSESDSGIAYEKDAGSQFQSDFFDLKKDQCASCHQAQESLASCTQCHNYHIGERGLTGIEDGFRAAVNSTDAAEGNIRLSSP